MSSFSRTIPFRLAFAVAGFVVGFAALSLWSATPPPAPQEPPKPPVVVEQPAQEKMQYTISTTIPDGYYSYPKVVELMKQWNKEAPAITEFGIYGKNRQNTDLTYLRIGTKGKPKILIHAGIHGNERLCVAATLGIMGKMLHDYNRVEDVTNIINERDVYFVPVFSPESYLKSRHIEQGDPNRNWPYPGSRADNTSSPIVAMRDFFLREKFCAVIDGHTFGRDFFYPSIAQGTDRQALSNLAIQMGAAANYDPAPVSRAPAGFAIDWYYWKGAVAILTEFGPGPHDASVDAIKPETERTYNAYLIFMDEAPKIKLAGIQSPNARQIRPQQPRINEMLIAPPPPRPQMQVQPQGRRWRWR